jgi:hypothetical protein
MKKLVFVVAGSALLLACGGAGKIPEHPVMPIVAVGEDVDEGLYTQQHCQVKKVATLDNGDIEAVAQSLGSNFVELLYQEPGKSGVVMFVCPQAVSVADDINERALRQH